MKEEHAALRAPLAQTLLALTFVTGIVDAVSFLGLGQVFAGMMTGNVLFVGFGAAGGAGASVWLPLTAIAAFVVGGSLAGLLAGRAGRDPERGLKLSTVAEVAMLTAAVGLALVTDIDAGEGSGYALVVLLALAMGLRTIAARRLGAYELTTTVVAVAVTGLAAASPVGWASREHLARRGAAAGALVLGAAAGTLLFKASFAAALAVAAGVSLACAVVLATSSRS